MLTFRHSALAILLATGIVSVFARSVSNSTFNILCHSTLDQLSEDPPKFDVNFCTHIIIIIPKHKIDFQNRIENASFDEQLRNRVAELKENRIKVLTSIGSTGDDASEQFSQLVGDATARSAFVHDSIAFLQQYGFDGLDLAWSHPVCWAGQCDKGQADEKENYGKLAQELSQAFKPAGLLVSATVPADPVLIDTGYDVAALSQHLDWLAVAVVDFHRDHLNGTVHSAPLHPYDGDEREPHNVANSLEYWTKLSADPRKLVMEIPTYGIRYTLTDASAHDLASPFDSFERATVDEVCQANSSQAWTAVRDPLSGTYAFKDDAWITFDDVSLVQNKALYIIEENHFGALLRNLELDDPENKCGYGKNPLLTAVHAVFAPAQSSTTKRNGATLDDEKLVECGHFHGSTCRCNQDADNHPNGNGNQTDCGCQGTGFVDIEYEVNQTIRVMPRRENQGYGTRTPLN